MKSRKFKAVLAAVSAIAVLATAMTGFAATVNTTTIYNNADGKVSVVSEVTGVNGEVTYLATTKAGAGVNESGILYIDQQTSSDGKAKFEYKVAQTAIADLETKVILGTDGTEAITQPTKGLELTATADTETETYKIAYDQDAYGNSNENLTIAVTPVGDNEIKSVKIGETTYEPAASYPVPVTAGVPAAVAVTTAPKTTTASIANEGVIVDNTASVKKVTTVIKVNGAKDGYELGVAYKGYTFPAAGNVNEDGYIAVVLENDVDFAAADISAYCVPAATNAD